MKDDFKYLCYNELMVSNNINEAWLDENQYNETNCESYYSNLTITQKFIKSSI